MTNLTQYVPAVNGGVYSAVTSFAPKASKFVVCVENAPPCWVSKYHLTVVGPLTSIVPVNLTVGVGPLHPLTTIVPGSTLTEILVTVALGDSITGMGARFPE